MSSARLTKSAIPSRAWQAEEELHVFNSQALSNFIFGLFKLKVRLRHSPLHHFLSPLRYSDHAAAPLCCLQYDPGPGFMETFFRASLSKLDRFTAAGFASMLHSAARMGKRHRPWPRRDTLAHTQHYPFPLTTLWSSVSGVQATTLVRPSSRSSRCTPRPSCPSSAGERVIAPASPHLTSGLQLRTLPRLTLRTCAVVLAVRRSGRSSTASPPSATARAGSSWRASGGRWPATRPC